MFPLFRGRAAAAYFFALIGILTLLLLSRCAEEAEEYFPETVEAAESTLILGIHPYLNSQSMYEAYAPLIAYVQERVPGVDIQLETSNSYEHYEEKLYAGSFHLALPNPFQTITSFTYGYYPVGKMYPDDVFRGIIVARKDRKLHEFSQLKGKTLSFPAATALAATMMPLMFLYENGVDIEKDIEKHYVGSQYSAILNAYSGDSFAGCTWPPPWEEWRKTNPEKAREMELVWKTEPLPNNGFVARNDVDEATARRIMEILVKMRFDEPGRQLLKKAGFDGFEFASYDSFAPIYDFLESYKEQIARHLAEAASGAGE